MDGVITRAADRDGSAAGGEGPAIAGAIPVALRINGKELARRCGSLLG
jgi:hypothetical protein